MKTKKIKFDVAENEQDEIETRFNWVRSKRKNTSAQLAKIERRAFEANQEFHKIKNQLTSQFSEDLTRAHNERMKKIIKDIENLKGKLNYDDASTSA